MFASRGRVSRFIAIDLSSDQFTAVHLTASHSGVKVGARVTTDIPADIEPSDDEWLGKWMARTLDENRFGRAPVVFVVPRQSVGLKHLALPSTRVDELPGMVAIKMAGQLPFPAAGSIIDYAVLSERAGESEVMAAAVRHELTDRYRALAKAGGLKIDRIALRPLATAALAADLSRHRSGSLLAIDLRRYGEVELVVICDGQVRFARATEVIAASEKVDRHEEARRLATEAKRSWMSYRATEESPDVEHILIIGSDGLAGGVASEVRSALGRPTEVLLSHPKVTGETSTLGAIWPLVGIGLERVEGLDNVNFFQPKQAPDLAAFRRQRVLGGIAAAVVVLGVAWTVANFHLRRLQGELDALDSTAREEWPDYLQFERTRLRLEHLARWEKARFDWLDHLAFISENLPATSQVILGSFGASMSDPVIRWKAGEWSAPVVSAQFQFNGAAVSRPIADAVRLAFVDEHLYETTPVGTDTSSNDKTYIEAFALRLGTLRSSPYPDGVRPSAQAQTDAPPPVDSAPIDPAPAEATSPTPTPPPALLPAPPSESTEAPAEQPKPQTPPAAGGRGRRRPKPGDGG